MSSWQVGLTDQSTAEVPPATLQQIAAALQQQVDNDFAPAWGVRADISVLPAGDPIPLGTWPVKIVDDISGAGGVHLDDQAQPYAEAVNGPQLSIAISHAPAVAVGAGDRIGLLQGVGIDSAATIVLPLGPALIVSTGDADAFHILSQEQVDARNQWQVQAASRYVYCRPGSGLVGAIRAAARRS